MKPLVSILIPTYNGEAFIAETLASARTQTHHEVEILVGDDASTDGTPEILARAAAADPRIRIIRHEENVGAFLNPIILLEQARGEYVKYLLHDDLLEPACVSMFVGAMEADPLVRLAFSRRSQINAQGIPLPDQPHLAALADGEALIDGTELADRMLELQVNLVGELTACLFRRSDVPHPRALWQIEGRRLAANGDLALWLTLLAGDGSRAFYSPHVLSHFRRHTEQRTADNRIKAYGLRDWPLLIDWAPRIGLLARPEQQRRALAALVRTAGADFARLSATPYAPVVLEALHLATTRLLELGGAVLPADPDASLVERAHAAAVRAAYAQELHLLPWRAAVAVAAPAVDAAEIAATIDALRTATADRLVLAVAPADVDEAVPLIEAALADGPDVDIDLVPCADPATLLQPGWMAVAPEGRAWAAGAPWLHRVATRPPAPASPAR
jgi:hypothetical protein